jgi:LPXTG-site transpeptidase (sortase) family protein
MAPSAIMEILISMENMTNRPKSARTIYLADRVLASVPYPKPPIDYFACNKPGKKVRTRRTGKLRQIKFRPKLDLKFNLRFNFNKLAVARFALVFTVLAVTGFLAFDTWRLNNTQSPGDSAVAVGETELSQDSIVVESDDDEQIVYSGGVVASSANTVGRIIIPSIGVNARVLYGGIDRQGNISAPATDHDTTWFNGSAHPGGDGATFISGHLGIRRPAVFANLTNLNNGDEIILEWGDGTRLVYVVQDVRNYSLDDLNMREALSVMSGHTRGLNLMTCAGTFVTSIDTYDHRTIVFAVLQ